MRVDVERLPRDPLPPIKSVTLELTPYEAGVLLSATDRIGGHPDKSGRKVFADLRHKLHQVGVQRQGKIDRGSVYFKED